MKKLLIIPVFVLSALSSYAQVKQEVIASAGGYNSASGVAISWTLGETLIPAFSSADGSVNLTHGFQHQLIITAVEENIDVPVSVKLYPNPASDILNIQLASSSLTGMEISMLDSHGRLVKADRIDPDVNEKQINLQDLPAGLYYLRIVKGKLINVYKVVKL